ncbi:MAG: hypothetical protein R2867_05335 [Caldilineaceae bacterium]
MKTTATLTSDDKAYQRLSQIRLRHCRSRHRATQRELEEIVAFARTSERNAAAAVDTADRLQVEIHFYIAQIRYHERIIASRSAHEMATHAAEYQNMMDHIEGLAQAGLGVGQMVAHPTVRAVH